MASDYGIRTSREWNLAVPFSFYGQLQDYNGFLTRPHHEGWRTWTATPLATGKHVVKKQP
jgi:hypothetical protein